MSDHSISKSNLSMSLDTPYTAISVMEIDWFYTLGQGQSLTVRPISSTHVVIILLIGCLYMGLVCQLTSTAAI